MAERSPNNRPNSLAGQGRYPRVVPDRDDVLLMLDEVAAMCEVSEWSIYKAVKEGRLRRVRRQGYQPYYVLSDVVACFGQPKNPPPLNSVKRRESVKGGQLSFSELESAA